jgi:ribosomal protein S12 methylthiotransferase accessory factor YcaO
VTLPSPATTPSPPQPLQTTRIPTHLTAVAVLGHNDLGSPELLDDVRTVQTRQEEAGLEVLVLDQTRPDIGLPVVKVIVPGLLYDVPVRLGRLTAPTAYEDLNPMPMFLQLMRKAGA